MDQHDFWLNVCRLAEVYKCEGNVEDERTKNLRDKFKSLPIVAQRELIENLAWLAIHLPDLYTVICADAWAAERTEAETRKRNAAG